MKLTLPYPPSANKYWRTWQGRMLRSREATAYTKAVLLLCKVAKLRPLDGPVSVRLRVFRPIRRGDLDNRIKVLLDALNGHAFHDDAQVVHIDARLFDDKANPRAEVEVVAMEEDE